VERERFLDDRRLGGDRPFGWPAARMFSLALRAFRDREREVFGGGIIRMR